MNAMVIAGDRPEAAGMLAVVVDDDMSVRRALARLLRSRKLVVETCASAEEYMTASRPCGVACLILDIHLGAMSGLDLLERLVEQGIAPPVIVITAHDSPQLRERARELGAVSFFRKPFDATSLLDAVGSVLGADLDGLGS
jgi:FixJ family two-component response regulator